MKKQILAVSLVMWSLIAGCGGDGGGAEAPKVNDYTEWASLLKSASNHGKTANPMLTLEDGRTIIGYKNLQGDLIAIVTLPSSYSSNLEEFKVVENAAKNGFLVTLNENIEDKPKSVFYFPNPDRLNKEKIQELYNQFQFVSYTRSGENPVNIPVEIVQASECEYLVEFSLPGSGEYLFYPIIRPHKQANKRTFREPPKQAPSLYMRDVARQARMSGPSSTILTGPQGVDLSQLTLDRKTLLGRNTLHDGN